MAVRLSVMMFLQYAILGAWAPVFGPYLKSLDFTFNETAWIWTAAAIGSVVAPLVWGQIADRWLPAERCIGLCAIGAGAMLWWASTVEDAWPLFWIFLAFWLFQMPVMSLGSALTFRHLDHPERQFGTIRLWGTVGWMVAGWVFSVWLKLSISPEDSVDDSLTWGAFYAFALAIYSFTLPATPPLPAREPAAEHGPWRRWFDAPVRAVQLFRVPAFAVYCICLFVLYVSWPFNMQMTSLLIKTLDVDSAWLPTILSLAQTTEVAMLATLPLLLRRLGQKRTMTLGIASWWLALVALASGGSRSIVIPSLLLHGVYICCFLVAGQVFVNRIAHHDFRASAQGLLVLINGLGQFVGNFVVSGLRDGTRDEYPRTFLPAAIGIGLLTVFFVAAFFPPSQEPLSVSTERDT